MNAVVFDTLRLAQKLESVGFSAAQAAGMAEALSESLGELATKRDLSDLEARIEARFRDLEARIDVRFRDVDARFASVDARFNALDARIASMDAGIRAELLALEQRMTIRLGAMIAGAVVLVGAMVKLL